MSPTSTAFEELPSRQSLLDFFGRFGDGKPAQVGAPKGIRDAFAHFIHGFDHFVKGDQVVVIRQGHIGA